MGAPVCVLLEARVPNNNVLRLEPDAINALEIAKPMFSRCGTTCAWSQATDPNEVHEQWVRFGVQV